MKMQIPENKILPIWQPVGISTHKMTVEIMEYFGVKATHTGTLDPMAEGVVIVLLDDLRFHKQELTSWKKKYEFDILVGLSTDSYDGMGFIKQINLGDYKKVTIGDIQNALSSLKGDYIQEVPMYSAIKYKGKKLFEYARSADYVFEVPQKQGVIYELKLLNSSEICLKKALSSVFDRLSHVKGDFRQEEIIKHWEEYLKTVDDTTQTLVLKIEAQVSRGLYIRSLSQDICQKLNIIGFVSSLIRTENGKYTKDDCLNYDKLFQ